MGLYGHTDLAMFEQWILGDGELSILLETLLSKFSPSKVIGVVQEYAQEEALP